MSHTAKITEWFTTRPTLTVEETAGLLGIKATSAAVNLSRWAKQGIVTRVGRGVYGAAKAAKGSARVAPSATTASPRDVLHAAREAVQARLAEAAVTLDACRAELARLDAACAALDG